MSGFKKWLKNQNTTYWPDPDDNMKDAWKAVLKLVRLEINIDHLSKAQILHNINKELEELAHEEK